MTIVGGLEGAKGILQMKLKYKDGTVVDPVEALKQKQAAAAASVSNPQAQPQMMEQPFEEAKVQGTQSAFIGNIPELEAKPKEEEELKKADDEDDFE